MWKNWNIPAVYTTYRKVYCKAVFNFENVSTQCLKIIEKVSFNNASEASYIYILSGQKLIKNAKKCPILVSFWKPEACGQTVLPDRSVLIRQKLVENAKIQMRYFELFSNNVSSLKSLKTNACNPKEVF